MMRLTRSGRQSPTVLPYPRAPRPGLRMMSSYKLLPRCPSDGQASPLEETWSATHWPLGGQAETRQSSHLASPRKNEPPHNSPSIAETNILQRSHHTSSLPKCSVPAPDEGDRSQRHTLEVYRPVYRVHHVDWLSWNHNPQPIPRASFCVRIL